MTSSHRPCRTRRYLRQRRRVPARKIVHHGLPPGHEAPTSSHRRNRSHLGTQFPETHLEFLAGSGGRFFLRNRANAASSLELSFRNRGALPGQPLLLHAKRNAFDPNFRAFTMDCGGQAESRRDAHKAGQLINVEEGYEHRVGKLVFARRKTPVTQLSSIQGGLHKARPAT